MCARNCAGGPQGPAGNPVGVGGLLPYQRGGTEPSKAYTEPRTIGPALSEEQEKRERGAARREAERKEEFWRSVTQGITVGVVLFLLLPRK